MILLGIETSCDETAAAVVRDGRVVLSSIVFSQVPLHSPYGGVVPEIASRSHIEKLPGVIREAVAVAQIAWTEIDAIAVTYGPGLASSLQVGLSAAKGLAWSLGKPLVGINHVEAHIHSVFLSPDAPAPAAVLPLLALVVSGGHSALVAVDRERRCRVLGQTLDDAAGEAFDKAAKLLNLGYPGGPAMEQAARRATVPAGVVFPRGRIGADNPALGALRADLCFSFSGLKTALLTHLKRHPATDAAGRDALAAAYQEAIVEALAARGARALQDGRYRALAVGGGVSLNGALRERLAAVAAARNVPLLLPLPRYCGDNAAMIAALAGSGIGITGEAAFDLDATPSLRLDG
jgi:N6-L-threonylcarbamoyladenine synthase